jgi:hypothetical protein
MRNSASPIPSSKEILHMRPSNNFEQITELQFDERERAKAEYRKELQQQIEETTRKKQL